MNFELEKKSNKITLNQEQTEYVINEYFVKERSMAQIGSDFPCSPQVIERTITNAGLKPREVGTSNRLYTANDNFFNVIDTEEKAYWLGMLYADGTIQEKRGTVNLGLQSSDESHIVKFLKSIDSNNPIKVYSKNMGENTFYSSRANIYSRQMVDDLVRLGCPQNKSLTLTFPTKEQVPLHLTHHFIRGYFDGDGSISHSTPYKKNRRQYRYSIVGTEHFINGVKHHLDIKNLKTSKRKTNLYCVGTCGRYQVEKVMSKMYDDATIYLDRKYEKYQEMIQYVAENPNVPWNKGMTKKQEEEWRMIN